MPADASYLNRHPWLLVVYLLTITCATFFVPDAWKPYLVPSLMALQLTILVAFGKLDRSLFRILNRLKFLFLFLIAANALLPGADNERHWQLLSWLSINVSGLATGVVMSAQILLVVLTTHVVRTVADERAFINGLRSLRIAPLLAYSLDTTLALLDGSLRKGGGGQGMGRGDGSGGGGGHAGEGGQGSWFNLFRRAKPAEAHPSPSDAMAQPAGVLALFSALRRRDLTPFIDKLNRGLNDAAAHAERLGLSDRRAHDVGVIGGISAAMMAFKLVKVLPGLPVLAGAKTIFFIPLYMLAADRTYSRWGGTMAGGIMGFIAFLNGDSRYGIFEVLKHVAPGLVIDLAWPLVRWIGPRFWVLLILGLVAAATRTATQFAIVFCLGADNLTMFLLPAERLVPNLIAGFLSVFVSYPIIKNLGSAARDKSNESSKGVEEQGSKEVDEDAKNEVEAPASTAAT